MVTNHFEKRVKQRTGLNKNKSKELFDKAVKDGLTYEDCLSRPSLIKYLDKIDVGRDKSMILYNRYIIIRSKRQDIAITILSLPQEFYSTIKSLQKRKDENNGSKLCQNS